MHYRNAKLRLHLFCWNSHWYCLLEYIMQEKGEGLLILHYFEFILFFLNFDELHIYIGYISTQVTCLHGLHVYAGHLFTRVRYFYVDYIFAWVPYLHESCGYASYLLTWGTCLQYIGCMFISITCFFQLVSFRRPSFLITYTFRTTTQQQPRAFYWEGGFSLLPLKRNFVSTSRHSAFCTGRWAILLLIKFGWCLVFCC